MSSSSFHLFSPKVLAWYGYLLRVIVHVESEDNTVCFTAFFHYQQINFIKIYDKLIDVHCNTCRMHNGNICKKNNPVSHPKLQYMQNKYQKHLQKHNPVSNPKLNLKCRGAISCQSCLTVAITEPADGPALNSARPSAGTIMTMLDSHTCVRLPVVNSADENTCWNSSTSVKIC